MKNNHQSKYKEKFKKENPHVMEMYQNLQYQASVSFRRKMKTYAKNLYREKRVKRMRQMKKYYHENKLAFNLFGQIRGLTRTGKMRQKKHNRKYQEANKLVLSMYANLIYYVEKDEALVLKR